MTELRRVSVLGVGISVIDLPLAISQVDTFVTEGCREYVCITGVHGVMESQRDGELLDIHNRSGLTTPDGMPMVWAGRWAGARSMQRVYGPTLMMEVCRAGVAKGWRHFFFGGEQGVADELRSNLETRLPGIRVVGTYSPPFRPLTDSENNEVIKLINSHHPDFVWVGLSTPKQERWMARSRPSLHAAVLVGVGAAFDIHAGRQKSAPSWMQRAGLEWLYRLVKEPRRLWRRYLLNNPAFLFRIIRNPPRILYP